MGDFLVVAGFNSNLLSRAASVTVSPSTDALYPASRLYDGRPIQPFKFGAATVLGTITVDGNLVSNGNFDTWSGGAPVGWIVSGTATEEAVIVRSGSSLRLNGLSSVVQDFSNIRAGERVTLELYRRITGAGQGEVRVSLQNLETQNYWTGSAWAAGATLLVQDTTNTSFTQFLGSLDVEPYPTVRADTCTLRLTISNADATATDYIYVEDVALWPSVDFMSVHGHSINSAIAVTLRSSTDNFAAVDTAEATATVIRPAFYVRLAAPVDRRYFRLQLSGTSTVPIYLGELVIGRARAMLQKMEPGYLLREVSDGIAAVSETGERMGVQRSTDLRRVLDMQFHYIGNTAYEEARDEIVRRSGINVYPLVVVPDSARSVVLHGTLTDQDFTVSELIANSDTDAYRDSARLTVSESPFPLLTR